MKGNQSTALQVTSGVSSRPWTFRRNRESQEMMEAGGGEERGAVGKSYSNAQTEDPPGVQGSLKSGQGDERAAGPWIPPRASRGSATGWRKPFKQGGSCSFSSDTSGQSASHGFLSSSAAKREGQSRASCHGAKGRFGAWGERAWPQCGAKCSSSSLVQLIRYPGS